VRQRNIPGKWKPPVQQSGRWTTACSATTLRNRKLKPQLLLSAVHFPLDNKNDKHCSLLMRAMSFIHMAATCWSVVLVDYLTFFHYVKITEKQHLTNTKHYKQFT